MLEKLGHPISPALNSVDKPAIGMRLAMPFWQALLKIFGEVTPACVPLFFEPGNELGVPEVSEKVLASQGLIDGGEVGRVVGDLVVSGGGLDSRRSCSRCRLYRRAVV